jgi:hypothetical protein
MAKTKFNLPAILDREIPDLAIPDPIQTTGFMRREHVECISNKDVEDDLTVGIVYHVVEPTDDEGVMIQNDNGDTKAYYNWHFKSVEHGPFKLNDEVQLLGFDDVEIVDKPRDSHYNIPDYVGSKFIVVASNETESVVRLKPGVIWKAPNRNLKYQKRYNMLKSNPFTKGDTVKCTKTGGADVIVGCLYTVHAVDNDLVYLTETRDQGNRYRYNLFVKWDKPSRIQARVKKYKTKMKLADHVRYYLNKNRGLRLTEIRKEMLIDKIIGDDVTLQDLKKICDTMFTWK